MNQWNVVSVFLIILASQCQSCGYECYSGDSEKGFKVVACPTGHCIWERHYMRYGVQKIVKKCVEREVGPRYYTLEEGCEDTSIPYRKKVCLCSGDRCNQFFYLMMQTPFAEDFVEATFTHNDTKTKVAENSVEGRKASAAGVIGFVNILMMFGR